MTGCGCGSDVGGGPILTGTLDPSFSPSASSANADTASLLGSDTVAAKPSTLFWEAVGVIVFLVVASWVVYKSEKKERD